MAVKIVYLSPQMGLAIKIRKLRTSFFSANDLVASCQWTSGVVKMRFHPLSKVFKRKPVAGVFLVLVLISAVVTLFRLTYISKEDNEYISSSQTRSTSPVELRWPLPLSQSQNQDSKASTPVLKRSAVNAEQIKKLRMIYPL